MIFVRQRRKLLKYYMAERQLLVQKVVEGIQEKKGKRIAVVDLTKLENAVCSYFVICEGDSSTHVNAVADSVVDYVQKQIKEKPIKKDGFKNSDWIAVDYGSLIVHMFLKEPRNFYNIESLWADADINWIDDIY